MTVVTGVITKNWQMSTTAFGAIVQGADDINQALNIILTTQKGTDPLRPDFGIDLLKWIDRPANIMAPGMVKDIIDGVADYETRIELSNISYTIKNGKVVFSLTWSYVDGTLYNSPDLPTATNTTQFLMTDEDGFILITDDNIALILD